MSPLELSLSRKQKKSCSKNSLIKYFNIIGILLIVGCFGFYAFIANDHVGNKIELRKLSETKEKLREEVSLQSATFHNLRTPSYIKTKTEDKMMLISSMNYVKTADEAIAVR